MRKYVDRTEIFFGHTCRNCGKDVFLSLPMNDNTVWMVCCSYCDHSEKFVLYKVDKRKMDFVGAHTKEDLLKMLEKGPING